VTDNNAPQRQATVSVSVTTTTGSVQ
jgi:hypothetical protein